MMGAATRLQRYQRLLAIGEEFNDLGSLELAALDFASIGIHDVKLENVLGDIQTYNG
jgi:hypothetical protein